MKESHDNHSFCWLLLMGILTLSFAHGEHKTSTFSTIFTRKFNMRTWKFSFWKRRFPSETMLNLGGSMLNLGGVACTNYDPARFQGTPWQRQMGQFYGFFNGPKSMALPRNFLGSKGTATALDLYCPQYCVTSVTTAYLARESLGCFFFRGGGEEVGSEVEVAWSIGEGGEILDFGRSLGG